MLYKCKSAIYEGGQDVKQRARHLIYVKDGARIMLISFLHKNNFTRRDPVRGKVRASTLLERL